MIKLFKKLFNNDQKFKELVVGGYEVWSYLAMNTDLSDEQCNEMEHLADKFLLGKLNVELK